MQQQMEFNTEQKDCMLKINEFITKGCNFSKLLINGSAGTGKTTILISCILEYVINNIRSNKHETDPKPNFIIAAPTHKAKDVLISKYNLFLTEIENNTHISTTTALATQAVNDTPTENAPENDTSDFNVSPIDIAVIDRQICFMTVSQVLSINKVINEIGEETFTKGNEHKITAKYTKKAYDKTVIVIDECSMLDSNAIRLFNIIRCPIIYLGDYCQLPPINEELSPIFNTTDFIQLNKVERCKNNIVSVANILRDKIYNTISDFNLLTHKITEIIFYPKRREQWLNKYIEDIKRKQVALKSAQEGVVIHDDSILADTMLLAWTNKCCAELNTKIRYKLFIDNLQHISQGTETDKYEGIEDISEHFLVRGDKLLVKTPYFKYDTEIYSSSIVYVDELAKTIYKPLDFKTWFDIGVSTTSVANALQQPLNEHELFYKYHGMCNASLMTYDFTDELSKKYRNICAGFDLLELCKINDIVLQYKLYKQWHQKMSIILFGIPQYGTHCKKCKYFITKFLEKYKGTTGDITKNNIFIEMCKFTASGDFKFDMYYADLVQFKNSSVHKNKCVPILDTTKPENISKLEQLREIVRKCFDIRIVLNANDERELKTLQFDEEITQRYITLSQLLGHYITHIITSNYLEITPGYCQTCHSAQGSTYYNVYIEYKNLLLNQRDPEKYKLLYTAITRVSNNLHIFY